MHPNTQPTTPNRVKLQSQLQNYWLGLALWLAVSVIFIALFILRYLYRLGDPSSLSLSLITFALLSLFALGQLLSYVFLRPRLKRLEQRRQTAASDQTSQLPLVTRQPQSNLSTLPLPPTLRFRVRILNIRTLLILVATFFSLLNLDFYVEAQNMSALSIALKVLIILLPLSLAYVWFSGRFDQNLEATAEGLTMRQFGKVEHVSWQDARLFAIESLLLSANQNQLPYTYELSSAHGLISWPNQLPLMTSVYAGPTREAHQLTLKEYQQQVQALLSLIAARTNLPLCDLR